VTASDARRSADHRVVAAHLTSLSDDALAELVAAGSGTRSGIGGTTAVVQVDGTTVFVKRVPLTDLERRPENRRSTANLFDLPTWYHYGIGSAGFGAWRELAAHLETTGWVLDGLHGSFPIMHHWRVLPGARRQPPTVDLEGTVAYWQGSPAVRERLQAIARSTADLVLFLEYVPYTLHEWLTTRVADGDAAAPVRAARSLADAVAFTASRGMVHFDVHPANVLTDGRRLHVADFGLAVSSGFTVSAREAAFVRDHRSFDRYDSVKYLVNWLVEAFCAPADRAVLLRECTTGRGLAALPPSIAAIIERHAPTTVVMNEFYRRLVHESKTVPYPADDLRRADTGHQ
jgi:hypothetical protein